ncbi:unnamed protein product [Schistosoma rodhaini]|uniref:Uncharacterized protein n=1 Tax=Schistosoma rodhaini TaxID=6188 RepID=A0AA85GBL1_9TREM|nr:unnamed protein product [Schistosoma rodhaini]CAH8621618.1 unnamed protein product [Schistosoma rodhaini]
MVCPNVYEDFRSQNKAMAILLLLEGQNVLSIGKSAIHELMRYIGLRLDPFRNCKSFKAKISQNISFSTSVELLKNNMRSGS